MNRSDPTLASSASWLAVTPNRGMVDGARLGLWVAFLTPLIWDMGRFFLSLSLVGGDMMSMSCCFSVRGMKTQCLQQLYHYPPSAYTNILKDTRFSPLPRKVLEMNSDTWFPERLVSDSWVSSRFSILLNYGHTHIQTHKFIK